MLRVQACVVLVLLEPYENVVCVAKRMDIGWCLIACDDASHDACEFVYDRNNAIVPCTHSNPRTAPLDVCRILVMVNSVPRAGCPIRMESIVRFESTLFDIIRSV